MENETKKESNNWFDEYDKPREEYEKLPIFEMKPIEGKLTRREIIEFVSEGHKATTKFGETIVFTILNQGVKKTWFIKRTQYDLLNSIAKENKKGTIVGKKAEVERAGKDKNDTRWAITFS